MRLQLTDTETLDVLESTPERLVVEATWSGGHKRPPLHLHPAQEEHFEVLEGTLEATVGEAEHRLQAGDTLVVPRGLAHRMAPAAGGGARARWTTEPALDTLGWWQALHDARAAHGGSPPLPVMARLLRAHRAEFRLATGPQVVQRPALALLAALPIGRRG
jgi:hypothetical protein